MGDIWVMSLEHRQQEPKKTGVVLETMWKKENGRPKETYKGTIAKEAQTQKLKTQDLQRIAEDRDGWHRLLSALCV